MEHKAYVLDYDAFSAELAPTLPAAMASGEASHLVAFVEANLHHLKDPYEGEPLPASWRHIFASADLNECGDVALTKYYDPAVDIGLGYTWDQAITELDLLGVDGKRIVLGRAFRTERAAFDPGKLGSYFQDPAMVESNLAIVLAYEPNVLKKYETLVAVRHMLDQAHSLGRGLYVTF